MAQRPPEGWQRRVLAARSRPGEDWHEPRGHRCDAVAGGRPGTASVRATRSDQVHHAIVAGLVRAHGRVIIGARGTAAPTDRGMAAPTMNVGPMDRLAKRYL